MRGFKRSSVTVNGVTLFYQHRRTEGIRLVMIPGSFLTTDSLYPLIALLPETWDILALELPGHCDSLPILANSSVEEYTEIALSVMHILHRSDCYLFGHSIGGMMALHALTSTTSLRGAILCEGWTYCSVKSKMEALGGNMFFTCDAQKLRLRELALSTIGWKEAQRISFAQIWRRFDGYASLSVTNVPVLELWGDRAIPQKLSKDVLGIPDRPNIELRLFQNAGHYLPYFKTVECAKAMKKFIQSS